MREQRTRSSREKGKGKISGKFITKEWIPDDPVSVKRTLKYSCT